MRTGLVAVGVLGAVIAAYVLVTSAANGAQTGYGTPPVFYVLATGLLAAAITAVFAAYRRSPRAIWAFAAGAVIGVIAWPYLAAGVVMAAGVALSVITNAAERRSTRSRLAS